MNRSHDSAARVGVRSSIDDLQPRDRSTDVDLALALLRRCASDLDYTSESLEAATGKNKAHISRVFNGLKPMTLEFLTALPDDLQGLYEARRAEQFGWFAVLPLTGVDAIKAAVAGLVGLMAQPSPAMRMAKADLPLRAKAANE